MSTVKQTVTALDSAISELTDRLISAQKRVNDLEQVATRITAEFAVGTIVPSSAGRTDGTPKAEKTTPGSRRAARGTLSPDAEIALEVALREKPRGTAELVKTTGASVASITAALRELRRRGHVHNVGASDAPLWAWVLGDNAPTSELIAEVTKLLRLPRAWELRELVAATGAGRNRVSGALARLNHADLGLRNIGTSYRARWTANDKVKR